MGTSRATRPAPETRELPEVLRSALVAGIVAASLEHAAGEAEGDYAVATADVLTTTATEIREWHAPKPGPAEQNGAY